MKLESFCTVKETVISVKRQPQMERVLDSYSSDVLLVSGLYKNRIINLCENKLNN